MKKILLAFTCLMAALSLAAQDNIAEEVAWVVGDQPIWKSEIEEQYRNMLYEKTTVEGDPYCVIPEQIAIEKLYLHQADLDTVEVQDNMVAAQVDSRINYFITQLGSREKMEEYFRKSLPEMRASMTEMIANQYRVQQVQNSLTKNIKVTPSDVRKYYDALPKDSVPFVPLQVEVQILTLNPVIPRQEIEDVKARLRDYADRVNRGESEFSTLAIFYSQDPGSAMRGGEIGFMGRGHLEPEYAAVAFNLNDPKKASKIVETQFGYHIIQLIEKRGDRINTRHILLQPKVSDNDLMDAIHRLDSLKMDIDAGKFTFEEALPYVSQDKDTRNNRGLMINQQTGTTRFEMSQLPQEIAKVVDTLKVGEMSAPFIMKDPKINRDIVVIAKLSARIPGHKANLSDDFQLIKDMYESSQRSKILSDWLAKKIADTYVRIDENWRNCEFQHKGWIKEGISQEIEEK